MREKRKIEIFSAGCRCCTETIEMVKRIADPSCVVEVLDMHRTEIADKAKDYGIASVAAVVIDGQLAGCCAGRGVDVAVLRAAGVGAPAT